MSIIRSQGYLKYASKINCDSNQGSILELQICANLHLQKEDSLLQIAIAEEIKAIRETGDTATLKRFMQVQELWEAYRYAHCSVYNDNMEGRVQAIEYMECAARLTAQRREELNGPKNEE